MFLAGRTIVDMSYSKVSKENLPRMLLQSLATNAGIYAAGSCFPVVKNQFMSMFSSTALATQTVASAFTKEVKSVVEISKKVLTPVLLHSMVSEQLGFTHL